MSTVRVVLADDHPVVRKGIREILESEGDVVIAGEANTGLQAIQMVQELMPNVVLMDVRMPEMDGVEATRRITTETSSCRVVILTTFDDDEYVFEAIKAGASGYLLKTVDPDELLKAVRSVSQGESLVHVSVAAKILREFSGLAQRGPRAQRPSYGLTDREQEVLRLLAQGLTNKEIGQKLFIRERTVKGHISNIFEKLHLRNRAEAVIYAMRMA